MFVDADKKVKWEKVREMLQSRTCAHGVDRLRQIMAVALRFDNRLSITYICKLAEGLDNDINQDFPISVQRRTNDLWVRLEKELPVEDR